MVMTPSEIERQLSESAKRQSEMNKAAAKARTVVSLGEQTPQQSNVGDLVNNGVVAGQPKR